MYSFKEYLLSTYYVWHPLCQAPKTRKHKDIMLLSPSSSVLGEVRHAVDSQAHLDTSCGSHNDGTR